MNGTAIYIYMHIHYLDLFIVYRKLSLHKRHKRESCRPILWISHEKKTSRQDFGIKDKRSSTKQKNWRPDGLHGVRPSLQVQWCETDKLSKSKVCMAARSCSSEFANYMICRRGDLDLWPFNCASFLCVILREYNITIEFEACLTFRSPFMKHFVPMVYEAR